MVEDDDGDGRRIPALKSEVVAPRTAEDRGGGPPGSISLFPPSPPMEGMDDAELRAELLELLREDARQSSEDLARLTGVEKARVRATMEALETTGAIRGYQTVVDWERVDGADERVEALVELNVTLDRETSYDDIARRLAKFDEIRSLRLVSGNYDFALNVAGDSMGAVSRFVSERVAPVPEVTQTVTHYVMDTYKQGGIEFEGRDDDRLSVTP